jgi:hypothetical protein
LGRLLKFISIFSYLFTSLGTLLGLHIFSKKMKLDDAPLAACACLMKAVSLMVLGLAEKSWVMYAGMYTYISRFARNINLIVIGSAVGVLGGISSPLCRAILSKSVHPDDVGESILFVW